MSLLAVRFGSGEEHGIANRLEKFGWRGTREHVSGQLCRLGEPLLPYEGWGLMRGVCSSLVP